MGKGEREAEEEEVEVVVVVGVSPVEGTVFVVKEESDGRAHEE